MNWIAATGDLYAAGRMIDLGVINMCPDFVAKGLYRDCHIDLTGLGWLGHVTSRARASCYFGYK